MHRSNVTWAGLALVFALLVLASRADDSEESSEEVILPPGQTQTVPSWQWNCQTCPPSTPQRLVCGTNGRTYRSPCHLRYHACLNGAYWRVAYPGWCTAVRPPVRPRPTPTRRIPTTRRRTTVRTTQSTTTTPAPTTASTTTTATTTPVMTTEPIPCPATCDLVFEPVCTTVGTYQSECAFNAVRCRNIISRDEMILFMGYCPESTAGP